MLLNVVIAADSLALERRLSALIEGADVRCESVPIDEPLDRSLSGRDVDLVLISRERLPDDPDSAVTRLRELPEHPGVIILQREPDAEEQAQLLADGCLAVISPNIAADTLRTTLGKLIDRQREELLALFRTERPEERFKLDDFISDSPAMQSFVDLARRVVRTESSLLLLGETGVGKGRLARTIHAEGPRSNGPFISVHCAALPESLIESELFGHDAGAFTGASRARKGYFELAHNGTLFLDEIGEVPLHVQVKLLKALEDHSIQRVGAERPVKINVRLMAATNRDLEREAQSGAFRLDLFYRLSVVTLTIPPLRQRREDITKLVLGYLEHFRQQVGRADIAITDEAMKVLVAYNWPGNVRELINAVERAVLLAPSERITREDLPQRILAATVSADDTAPSTAGDTPLTIDDSLLATPLPEARARLVTSFEHGYLDRLLRETRGTIGLTARRAGINNRNLYDLMKRYGLRKEDYK